MSEQQNEQEGIRMMDLVKDAINRNNQKWKVKELAQQEKVHNGVKIVHVIKKGYLVLQQQIENFQKIIQPLEQLNQAKKQQATKQLQQAKKTTAANARSIYTTF